MALHEHDQAPDRPIAPRRPLSDEVSERIAQELIFNGAVAAGELLPSEKELTERYGVSRVTVRAGLRSLREAGLISVRQGVGAKVLPRIDAEHYPLERLCSVETFAREGGQELTIEDMEIETVAPDPDTAQVLELTGDELVSRRVLSSRGERIGWLVDHVGVDVVTRERLTEANGAAIDALLGNPQAAVEYADCRMSPVTLPESIAEILGVESATLALLLDEVLHTADGRPIARCQSWYLDRPDMPPFAVRRWRRNGD
jgi:DNA-binding GntR family transcriptional regulator